MANKNTKARKQALRNAIRTGDNKVVSASQTRNMQQVVYKNEGGGSITRHEPIDKTRPFVNSGKVSTEKQLGNIKNNKNNKQPKYTPVPSNAASFGEER